jgi:DNA-binding MarR family transcriptional regulator
MVELTEQGRQLMRRRRKRVREAYQHLFTKLGKPEQEKFINALRTLDELLSQATE